MVLFMQIQNLSREASQKEHLHFCTWSTTDNVPLPVTHYKDTSQWQEAISRPIIKINIPKSNFHISMHKPQHFLLLCLNFFIAYIYSSDTCCIKASFISLVLEIEISSKQILSLWCFSRMFFLSFLIFYLICLLLGKLLGNYVCERWWSIISAIIVIIFLRFSNLITTNYTYLFSG